MKQDIMDKIRDFAKKHFVNNKDSAHNFEHVERVYNLAVELAEGEDVDINVIKIAALLHDIGGELELKDPSGQTDHAEQSVKLAKPFLQGLNLPVQTIEHILDCILSHRYRTENKPKTKEAMIVFDADKLETVGAIGIARAFVWVGKNNAHIYKTADIEKYANENLGGKANGRIQDKTKHSPQINWETKDKRIVEYLYTKKAKEIAKKRKKFSEKFFAELEKEINGAK
ncbi:MAG: HD domain-containing protein [Candidatus Berkelbacteria bacterium]|nr:HD domain-containing protein [Candidatus Berkelbacteria bacterium]